MQLHLYTGGMGSKKLEVSDFGKDVNRAVLSGMGLRRLNSVSLAEQIGRSPTYVQQRIRGTREWAISDVQRICDAWNISRDDFLDDVRRLS